MQKQIVIVGGGISGLVATWQLSQAGVDVLLLEARSRYGGRILTLDQHIAQCDMGPSWFWEGQPIIASLLTHFGLGHHEQYSEGTVLVQDATGSITQSPMRSPMYGSKRVNGGLSALVNAIVNQIPEENRSLNHAVTGLTRHDDHILIDVHHDGHISQIEAQHVALAIPLRLASEITFTPNLPHQAQHTLEDTPTWMAGHAKFFAVYDRPFWREKGLCGTAISRRGPLAEIHDATPHNEQVFTLFGFIGLNSEQRDIVGQEQLTAQALIQLSSLFGVDAMNPKATYLQDWSTEAFTANTADRQPQTQHPNYRVNLDLGADWQDKVSFIVSETSHNNSGLVEGGLSAGLAFAKRHHAVDTFSFEMNALKEHKASMDWDWL